MRPQVRLVKMVLFRDYFCSMARGECSREFIMLQSLQACRAVAALLVVLFHASLSIFPLPKYFGQEPFGRVFGFGMYGVEFFFVLSGFIMMHVHQRDMGKPRTLGAYFWKRFTRIYPTYWIVLAFVVPVFFLTPTLGKGHERQLESILFSILLLPHPDVANVMILVVAWTLVYEVFFYLLFGVALLERRLGMLLLLTWAALCLCPIGLPTTFPWSFFFSSYNVYFLTGLGVALLARRWSVPLPRTVAAVGASLFVLTGTLEVYCSLLPQIHLLGSTCGCGLLILGLIQAERRQLLHIPSLFVYLGNASYSIYLLHFPVLSLGAKIGKALRLDQFLPARVLFVLLIVGVVAVCCLFHQVVERRLLAWSKGFRSRPCVHVPPTQWVMPVPEPGSSRVAA
jgi:peptidoglycan/LPS O-acetylase OafA/YrhL